MKKSLLVILIFTTLSISAQDFKFGKVSKEELSEKFYPLDSTADAAYLYKYRNTYYKYKQGIGYMIITEVHERIKIYTKDGFEKATKKIYYYTPKSSDNEKVESIKGYTFNLVNNKIKKNKISKSNVFKESLNNYYSSKKIVMPNIKEASIIELKYKIESPYYGKINKVDFQFDIPVKKYESTVSIPEFFTFSKKTKGYFLIAPKLSKKTTRISSTSTDNYQGRNGTLKVTEFSRQISDYIVESSKFFADNIPALRDDEPFTNNISNYRGGIRYEISAIKLRNAIPKYYSANWEDVSKQIYASASFGTELNKSSYYKNDLTSLLANAKTKVDKIGAIFSLVKSKVKWNGTYGKYTYNGVRKAYKEGIGNAADINLMLTSMLRFAGLNANPVLVSTKDNGVPVFPTNNGFNYVVSMINFDDNTNMLLDATEVYSTPNVLPARTLNWKGRKVEENGNSSWVNLVSSKYALEENIVMVKVTDDFIVEGMIRTKYDNLYALNYRKRFNNTKDESLISNFEEKYNLEVDNFKVINNDKIYKPILRTVKFLSEDLVEEINNKIYIEPLLFLSRKSNLFKLSERKFPVDFTTKWQEKNTVTIQIPEGYKVETLPATAAIGLPENLGVFKYQVTQNGSKIQAFSILQFNSAIIVPQYYAALKDFYGQMVKKQSKKIVLVKE
jgi:hypothetical protein